MPINPFCPGTPISPTYLVGRESLIGTAFDQIANRAHLAFYGDSGLGKTSLLLYLSASTVWQQRGRNSATVFIVYFNCTEIEPFTPSRFWQEILTLLKDEAKDDTRLRSQIDSILQQEAIEADDLRQVLREIGQRDKFLLLLLDEYEAALRTNENYSQVERLKFLREFRNLAIHRKERRYLSTIVTTGSRLDQLGPPTNPNESSPWYNHYLYRVLSPFSSKDIASLFARSQLKRLQSCAITLATDILELTGGHPRLVHDAGYLLYETIREQKIPTVETFISDFQRQTQQFFSTAWNLLTDVEQILLMLIALSRCKGHVNNRQFATNDLNSIFSKNERELIDLEKRGIIQCQEDSRNKVYYFSSSMMEWWVMKEIENSNMEQLLEREKIFLKLMTRSQKEQVFKVIQHTWKNRQAVHSVIKTFSSMISKLESGS